MDDYHGNVTEFLENTTGPVVLVDQPWNRAYRVTLSKYEAANRLRVVSSLSAIPAALAELM